MPKEKDTIAEFLTLWRGLSDEGKRQALKKMKKLTGNNEEFSMPMETIKSPAQAGLYEVLYKGTPIYASSSAAECERLSARLQSLPAEEFAKELKELANILP